MPLPPPSCGVAACRSPRRSMRADWPQGCRSSERRGTRLDRRMPVHFSTKGDHLMTNRLQVGVDFSLKRADFCLLFPNGQPLEPHIAFANSLPGYSLAKRLLLDALDNYSFEGIDLSGEATRRCKWPDTLQRDWLHFTSRNGNQTLVWCRQGLGHKHKPRPKQRERARVLFVTFARVSAM